MSPPRYSLFTLLTSIIDGHKNMLSLLSHGIVNTTYYNFKGEPGIGPQGNVDR